MSNKTKLILENALRIQEEREAQYAGSATGRFEAIARLSGEITGKPFTAADVAAVLLSLKIDRARLNPKHVDSGSDGVNYLAFWVEELEKEEQERRTQAIPKQQIPYVKDKPEVQLDKLVHAIDSSK